MNSWDGIVTDDRPTVVLRTRMLEASAAVIRGSVEVYSKPLNIQSLCAKILI